MQLVATPSRGALVLRGLANILLGIVAVTWPGLTLYVLILAFAFNILIVGLFTVFEPLFDKKNTHAFLTVLLGIMGITVGIFLVSRPEFVTSVAMLLIAFWALLFGISDLYVGLAMQGEKIRNSWLFILTGILSFIFGVYVLFNPVSGALSLVWAIGVYSIVTGSFLVGASFVKPAKPTRSKKK